MPEYTYLKFAPTYVEPDIFYKLEGKYKCAMKINFNGEDPIIQNNILLFDDKSRSKEYYQISEGEFNIALAKARKMMKIPERLSA